MNKEITNYPMISWYENNNPGYLHIDEMSEQETSELFDRLEN